MPKHTNLFVDNLLSIAIHDCANADIEKIEKYIPILTLYTDTDANCPANISSITIAIKNKVLTPCLYSSFLIYQITNKTGSLVIN